MLKNAPVSYEICFAYRSLVPPRLHLPSSETFIDLVNTPRCEWEGLLYPEDVEEITAMVKRWTDAVAGGASPREAASQALTGKGAE